MREAQRSPSSSEEPEDWAALADPAEGGPVDHARVGELLAGELVALGVALLRRTLGVK